MYQKQIRHTAIDFYPRPPGGGRRGAERRGRRLILFLSTPSGWRATDTVHAIGTGLLYFYPRPPGGGRRSFICRYPERARFLSTPSGWRATCAVAFRVERNIISIHALRVEGDSSL